MPRIDQVLQPGAEESSCGSAAGCLGRIGGLPARASAEGITRRLAPQLTGRFARFSAAATAEPANSDTSRVPETRRKPRTSAYFTADYTLMSAVSSSRRSRSLLVSQAIWHSRRWTGQEARS